jgi:hypothetical protein
VRGWRIRSRAWSLALLSGPLALHRSGQAPETGRLYSAVAHHTCNMLHVPGSSYLDLVNLSYWSESEVQLYLIWSIMRPVIASSFRVKGQAK